ncbi:tripartite motif-containing protein 43-like protein, partial [Leptotrombidium deliense]
IVLCDDVRNLRFGEDDGEESLNSDTSIYCAAWGDQGFSSGQHYWELDVSDSREWAVGVCRESVVSMNHTDIEFKDMLLLLCVKADTHFSLLTSSPILSLYIEKPVARVEFPYMEISCWVPELPCQAIFYPQATHN